MTLAETMIKGIEIQSTLAHLYCIVYCVRAIGGIVGCVWVLYAESGATLLEGVWWRENKNKLVEWKALVDTVGIKSADLKDKFLF